MKLLSIRSRQKATCLFLLFLLNTLYSCELLEQIVDWPPKHSSKATQESADVVYNWYNLIAQTQLRTAPPPSVVLNLRNFGYIGVGLYEAVRPGIKGGVSLSSKLYQMPAMPEPDWHGDYLWGASANAALASMFKQFLVGLTDTDKARIDSLENANNNQFKLSTSDAVLSRSQAFGRSIATAIHDWSTTDNFKFSSEGYVLPVFPGSWVPTPPAFLNPVGAFIKDSRPFLASSLTIPIPPLPYPYSEDKSSPFYKGVKEVYDIGKTLTAEQKAIAGWWADVGGVGVGIPSPGHALSIITGVLESQKAKLGQAAQIYAKTGIVFKDAIFIIWRGKFQYNLLRPITYVNRKIDPNWQSYLITPPYPEYPSGLAGVTTPLMQVLLRAYGDIPITDNTYVWRGTAPRQYASITELVEEAAMSRVYGGIHYKSTQKVTLELGRKLGDTIANIELVSQQ